MDKKSTIQFTAFQTGHIPLWDEWCQKSHIKDVWFADGYEPPSYITQKIEGNGYDYPFVIIIDEKPVGYIVCCDLYAYRTINPLPKGNFTQEDPGSYCIDLFIGNEEYLNRGFGTEIMTQFTQYVIEHFKAEKVLIDPETDNKRAIRCYGKVGYKFLRYGHDGVSGSTVMQLLCNI